MSFEDSCNQLLYSHSFYQVDTLFRLAKTEEQRLHLFELLPLEHIAPQELFKHIPRDNAHQIFDLLAKEYFELGFPGKALTLLREALQQRQLCSEQLTRLALDCEGSLLPDFHTLPEYFQQAKWIFVINTQLYREYLHQDLRPALERNLLLANEHGQEELLALRDEDVLDVLLKVIFSSG
jgi:hypothetical protein